ncbi:menaquinone-dependent protoporphyrinogen IX dehydrogenase [Flavobacterium degerlachei]|jgi:menaquinone-dependent protoporphyrinogen oxidase|uniref:Menaquinone-dependent protoporphyrinogen oxidase n=1 Tax=Flavobacterium degerlachei TaxID=229203 RepID=A0A1H3DUE7_9FLAO|nr:menaquinone-dependent protoporphyrinogen IX dehydrogenase [Flavobacterium degerlachei]SDX69977.1 menaquinone-dependent protoporphyrinogen oxidase [Flavobacterium degerlachei]
MKLLIIYGTTEGQTRKIAHYMEAILQNAGHQVTIADTTADPPEPKGYDAIILGSSIHMHKYHSAIKHYIKKHLEQLNNIPGAFFSVSLAVASGLDEENLEVQKITNDFLEQTGWKPMMTTQIAGALKYTDYDYFKRLIMKMISKKQGGATDTSQDYEYTNWDEVTKFTNDFAKTASQKQ